MPAESLKFYFDANVSKKIVLQLRAKGVDVLHCAEVGLSDASDRTHLEYATEHERAIVSFDHHFTGLHAEWQENGRNHTGIFYVAHYLQGDEGIGVIVRFLLDYSELVESDAGTIEVDIYNHLYFVKE